MKCTQVTSADGPVKTTRLSPSLLSLNQELLVFILIRLPLSKEDPDPYTVAATCTAIHVLYSNYTHKIWSELLRMHAPEEMPVAVPCGDVVAVQREARYRCNRLLRPDLLNTMAEGELQQFQRSGFKTLSFHNDTLLYLPEGQLHLPSSQ